MTDHQLTDRARQAADGLTPAELRRLIAILEQLAQERESQQPKPIAQPGVAPDAPPEKTAPTGVNAKEQPDPVKTLIDELNAGSRRRRPGEKSAKTMPPAKPKSRVRSKGLKSPPGQKRSAKGGKGKGGGGGGGG